MTGTVPLRALILAFATGTALVQTLPALPDLRWVWILLPLLVLPTLLPASPAGHRGRRAIWLLVAFSAGVAYAAWRAELRLDDALPPAWEGRDVRLIGEVRGLPEATPRGWRVTLTVEEVLTPGARLPERVQVNLHSFTGETMPVPRGGACLALGARLFRPQGSRNFGAFDYQAWLLERGIRAQGYALSAPEASTGCGFSLGRIVHATRQTVRDRLAAALAGRPYAGIVTALAVGDQDAIVASQWTLFRQTGVTHLMSISGLHVTLLASMVFLLVNRAWRLVAFLSVRLPARRAASLAGLATAIGYVALAGFGLPALRTLFMVATLAVALSVDRTVSPTRALAAALGAVALVDPWAALAPGFWLSFGAVAALFLANSLRLGRPVPWWMAWLRAQWAVTLALCPMLLLVFGEVSVVSPLANAFAIPLVSLLAVPLTLIAIVLPVDVLVIAAHAVIDVVMHGLHWLASLPQPVWYGAAPAWPAVALGMVGAAVLLLPRGVPGRWLGVILLLPLLFPRVERPAPGEFWLDVLDVGQGLAVVLRTAGHTMVYDAGPVYASGEDAGARVVAPFLHARGISRLDALMVSHADQDHSGGMDALLLSHAPVLRLGPPAMAAGRRCAAGQRWRWDGVDFRVLHPPVRWQSNRNFSDNDLSCVLRISTTHGTALLAGDIERLGELELLHAITTDLRADILVVPHHGSDSSSTPEFVDAVSPAFAIVSAGRRNRFGHPHAAVVARYRHVGAELLGTDRHGGLAVRAAPGGIVVLRAEQAARRYWHDR